MPPSRRLRRISGPDLAAIFKRSEDRCQFTAQHLQRPVPPDPNEFWYGWVRRLGRDVEALLAETVDPPSPVGRCLEDVAEIRRMAIALEARVSDYLEKHK